MRQRRLAILTCVCFAFLALWVLVLALPMMNATAAVHRYNADASCNLGSHSSAHACVARGLVLVYKREYRKAPYDFAFEDDSKRYLFQAWESAGAPALYSIALGDRVQGQFFEGSLIAIVVGRQFVYGTLAPQSRIGAEQSNLIMPFMIGIVVFVLLKDAWRNAARA